MAVTESKSGVWGEEEGGERGIGLTFMFLEFASKVQAAVWSSYECQMDVGSATAAAFMLMLLLSLSRPTQSCKKCGAPGRAGVVQKVGMCHRMWS